MRKRIGLTAALMAVVLFAGQVTVMADTCFAKNAAEDTASESPEKDDEFPADENGQYVLVEGAGRVSLSREYFSSENEGVETYSLKKDGDTYLSDNFQVKEFACKDGADEILIDGQLVDILQQIRDHFGAAVTITSGYRTAAHNRAVGGVSNSYHMYGMAADIKVSGHTPREVAAYAESIGVKGIGLYTSWVHVDTRRKSCSYYWNSVTDVTYEVDTFAVKESSVPGDANGDGRVTADDSLCILKDVVGLARLGENGRRLADLNGNGVVDASDSLMILTRIVRQR